MSQACSGGSDGQATRRTAAAFRVADGLGLAASPTFAIMALLTGVVGGGPAGMHDSAAHGSPLSGMLTMYLLMSAFHAAPWLKLCNRRKANIADATVTCAATSSGTAASPTSEPASPAGRIPTSSIAAATCIA